MIKKIFAFSLFFFSFSAFASNDFNTLLPPIKPHYSRCAQAVPTTDPAFCASFKSVAKCHCTSAGLPGGMCNDMNVIYARMIAIFRTVERACKFQHDTDTQTCIDDWHCYRVGGKNSRGELCSSSGNKC